MGFPFFVVRGNVCCDTPGMLCPVVDISASVFTSGLHTASGSTRSGSLGRSHSFLGNVDGLGHVHRPIHVCGLLDSLEYAGASQNPNGSLSPKVHLRSFFFFFWPLPQVLPQAAATLDSCCLLFLKTPSENRLFVLISQLSQVRISHTRKICRHPPDRPRNDRSLKLMLFRNSKPLPPPGATSRLFVTMIKQPLFFRVTTELRQGDRNRVTCNVLTKIQLF